MKMLKIFSIVGIVCFFYLYSFSQTAIKKELIDKDVALFQQFFQLFPLNDQTTVDELNKKLKGYTDIEANPIGFDGDLHWWILTGGTTLLDVNILSYKNRIVMVQSTIFKKYLRHLKLAFNQNKSIKTKFEQLFTLKVNPNYFNDSVYQYTYANQSLFEEYQNHISGFLGKQTNTDIANCKFEYDLLNNPTERYQFTDTYYENYAPTFAIINLMKENRADLILNSIRGPSLSGRIYAITGLLIMGYEGKYILTKEDKDLIKYVLNLKLEVEDARSSGKRTIYSKCINPDLLKVLDDNFKYKKGNTYPEEKPFIDGFEQSPEYKGGYDEMVKFLRLNLKYPIEALREGISGTVFVQFVISRSGEMTNLKILRGIGGGCDEEAVHVVKLMPNWIPGRQNGQAVPVMFQIPVKFSLPIKAN